MGRILQYALLVFILSVIGLCCGALIAATNPIHASYEDEAASAPGEGVLCVWAITAMASEVGRRCQVEQDEAFQAALDESVERIDDYVMANSDIDAEGVAQFKSQQATLRIGPREMCPNELVDFYNLMQAQGAGAARAITDEILARPGIPQWGDCL